MTQKLEIKANFSKKNEWDRISLRWSIGDKKGKGPTVAPKGPLDNIGKYNSKELEETFLNK